MSLYTVVFSSADEHGVWRQRRHAELAAPDGWLSLIGLYWLEEGRHSVGSAAGASVCLPDGPPCLGELAVRHGQVFWCPENLPERPLRTDRDGSPEVVEAGDLAFHVIERNGRFALRVRDRAWASHNPFNGVEAYPFDPAWQVEADWVALDSPMLLEVPDVSGDLKTVEVAFRADFTLAGERYSLLPMSVSEREVFFVFRDRSSGRETYGAGRFLKANPAVDGKIGLDFNRAFNPPCAFTPFATCPLPPPENWLSVAVTAGEKKWQKPV